MSYTKEQIDQLWKESVRRERSLVAEYKRTHYIPSRATISTPEIDAERAERKLSSARCVALHAALLHSSEFGSFWL